MALEDLNKRNSGENNNAKSFWLDIKNEEILKLISGDFQIDNLNISKNEKNKISEILNCKEFIERQIWFSDFIGLIWFSGELKNISSIKIEENVDWIYIISLESWEFDELRVHIEFCNNQIKRDKLVVNKFRTGNGYWTKSVIQMIGFAKKKWFEKIYLTAAKIYSLDKRYKSKGYSFFPKLWFIYNWRYENNYLKKLKKSSDIRIRECKSLNELFVLKDEKWNNIWLDFWKQKWDSISLEFDLSDNSESIKRLNNFLKSLK